MEQPQIEWRLPTRLVRGGLTRSPHSETSEALYLTSGYVYDTAEEAAAVFAALASIRAYPVVTHTHYMYGVATSGSGGGRSGDGCFAAARPFVWGLHT